MKKNLLNQFIAESVTYYISEENKNQKTLAIALDISEAYLSNCLNFKKNFNTKHIYIISRELNISVEQLFPNPETFNIIKNSLGYKDYNSFINNLNSELSKGEE